MEFAWVGLNYLGIERTTTEPVVRSVADIHLAYMPYSHSVATAVGAGLIAWMAIEKGLGHAALGRAVGIGIVSHLVLDLLTHARDIVLWPGSTFPALGLGLYSYPGALAFSVELLYGVLCWWIYRGRRALLAVVVLGNLANVSLFFASVPGPEQFLAGHPQVIVSFILVQIVTMLILVGWFSSPSQSPRE
jgi:membrane-bound metal-dependent hydrolase YbcI (DUF457 family)